MLMPTKTTPTRKQVIRQVIAALDGPTPLGDVIDRVRQLYPSPAKDPRHAIRNELPRLDGRDFVFLDKQTILPMRLALQGVRFRIRLDRQEVQHGGLIVQPAFDYFLSRPPEQASFVDTHDQPLPTRITTFPMDVVDELFGQQTVDVEAFDLSDWFRTQRVRANDDVLVTILDWETAHFRLEHEPANRRRKELIAQQNRALADIFHELMEETYDERIRLRVAVPTAYARLPAARDYPGDHWLFVLYEDERMQTDGRQIMPADQLLPFERMFMDEEETAVREQPFTREQGQQVYRFRASTRGRKRERIIEIQGEQTLAHFDNVMREAFDRDPMDHLSEFTRIIRRGKGKQPREVHYGELNPFEMTAAAELRLAGLGLEVGAELQYVYDFGDWIEHRLLLESICAPEHGVEYPRVVPVAPGPEKTRQR
jgi:hypothetical protein